MGYLYQPKLKSGGRSSIWWAKWCVDGRPMRESTGTEKKREAETFLKDREAPAGPPTLGVVKGLGKAAGSA
jgi:hypothetical protein